MGSPINVRNLTGNQPYIGTIGNLIRSYSFLNISKVKKKKNREEGRKREQKEWGRNKGKKGERERLRLLCNFFFPSCFKTETGLLSNPAHDPDSQACRLKYCSTLGFHFPKAALTLT